jgi:hypothetical protein
MPIPKAKRKPQPINGQTALQKLAQAKRLPIQFLEELEIHDLTGGGIGIPYADDTGARLFIRERDSARCNGSRFHQPYGTKVAAYGQWRLSEAHKAGFMILVEGESDLWTLLFHGLPGLGIPGANNAKVLTKEHVCCAQKIYIVREPGQSGDTFIPQVLKRLAHLEFKGQVFEVRMPDGIKDPSDLHVDDPDRFKARLQEAIKCSQPLEIPLEATEPVAGPLEEIDAMDLKTTEEIEALESLPLLGQDGYIIKRASNALSASPKLGKTTLIYPCLKEWLEMGESILYLTEESKFVWQQRLIGLDIINQRGLILVFGLGLEVDQLLDRVSKGSETVIVIDTLRGLGILPEQENDNGLVHSALKPWITVCREKGKTLLGLVHDRKAGGKYGLGVSGAHALVGAVDIVLELRRGREHNQRIVSALSRLAQPPELTYEQDDKGKMQVVEGGNHDESALRKCAIRKCATRPDYLELMPQGEPGWPIENLMQCAKISKATALAFVNNAVQSRKLKKTGTGVKGDPFMYHRL